MLPRGANPLLAMRKAGRRPVVPVWVTVGDYPEPDWHKWTTTCHRPELLIRPEDPINRLDLRCLVGLEVVLFAAEWTDLAAATFERLKDYASEICVQSPAFEDDIGWWWLRKYGQVDFYKRHVISSLVAAQEACSKAATSRNGNDAYKAAQAVEKKLLAENQWLITGGE